MSFEFVEVSPVDVILDPSAVERDDGFVYSHLKRYCSKFTPLPAIIVNVRSGRLVAADRHKYLSIARELGHDRIRAFLQGATFEELRKQGVPGLISLIPKTLLDEEERQTVVTGWHIFFFQSSPPPEVAAEIEAGFREFLSESLPVVLGGGQVQIESHFDFSGPCLEIQFPTPVIHHAWVSAYLALASSVSRDIWPIETYQGRRFGRQDT